MADLGLRTGKGKLGHLGPISSDGVVGGLSLSSVLALSCIGPDEVDNFLSFSFRPRLIDKEKVAADQKNQTVTKPNLQP